MSDKKWDPNKFEPKCRMDVHRRNTNIDAKEKLCERCEGTGYRACITCIGTGIAPEDEVDDDLV